MQGSRKQAILTKKGKEIYINTLPLVHLSVSVNANLK
jgi:hypothetical protein